MSGAHAAEVQSQKRQVLVARPERGRDRGIGEEGRGDTGQFRGRGDTGRDEWGSRADGGQGCNYNKQLQRLTARWVGGHASYLSQPPQYVPV